jgi:rod shape-determining protein MreC
VARSGGSQRRTRLTLVLLVLVSITLLTLDGRNFGPLASVRSGVGGLFAPVGSAMDTITRPARDAWNGAFSYDELREENDRLAVRVEELERGEAAAETARRELEQLAADLDLDAVSNIDSVVARVVSGGVGNFDGGLQIDRGSDSGISVGMPVVGGTGLVGRVIQVSSNRSTVQLVSDPAFSVGVRVVGGPGLGVVTGQGNPVGARATGFDNGVALTEGDLLVTSGTLRSLFPPDLAVGRVTSVTSDAAGLEKEADIEFAARFSDLRYVTVLLWEPPQ